MLVGELWTLFAEVGEVEDTRLVDHGRRLVDVYLEGSDGDRDRLRQLLRERLELVDALYTFVLPGLAAEARTGDGEALRLTVAMVSLLDGYPDARDATLLLGDLIGVADERGLEVAEIFREVASKSSTRPGSWMGGLSSRDAFVELGQAAARRGPEWSRRQRPRAKAGKPRP